MKGLVYKGCETRFIKEHGVGEVDLHLWEDADLKEYMLPVFPEERAQFNPATYSPK